MTDKYQRIRDALAMGPTPGPWADGPLYSVVTQDYCAGKNPAIALVELIPAKLDECMANKSLICACDPETIQSLIVERDDLREALQQLDRIHRGLDAWHEDAWAAAWAKARAALAKGG